MPLSIWEYLRERTRDAVLAGFQDALDIAEQGDTNGSQHAAATQLRTRLGAPETTQLPIPSVNGEARTEDSPREPTQAVEKAPNGSAEHPSFDDELESRLECRSPAERPPAAFPGPSEGRRSAAEAREAAEGRDPLMVTGRERDLVAALASKIRMLAFEQIVTTWWPPGSRSAPTNARRRLSELVRVGLLARERVLARPLLPLLEPAFRWKPGEDAPLFGELSWTLQKRWTEPAAR